MTVVKTVPATERASGPLVGVAALALTPLVAGLEGPVLVITIARPDLPGAYPFTYHLGVLRGTLVAP